MGAFRDFGSGEGGNLLELADRLGVRVPPPKTAEDWARRRGFNLFHLAERWGVQVEDGNRPALVYPVGRRQRVKFIDKGKPPFIWRGSGDVGGHVYGLDRVRGSGPVYIVNGEGSTWAAHEASVDAVSFTRGEGAPPTPEQAAQLAELGRPLRVVFDVDPAGHRGAHPTVKALRDAGAGDVDALELPLELGRKGDVEDLWRKVGKNLGRALAELPALPPLDEARAGAIVWRFGGQVVRVEASDDDEDLEEEERKPPKRTPIARAVTPRALAESADGQAPGVELEYRDQAGRQRTCVVPAEAFADKRDQAVEGKRLASLGVQVLTGRGQALVDALGRWRDTHHRHARRIITVARPGWHAQGGRRVYAARYSGKVYGADWHWTGAEALGSPTGDASDVIREVGDLADTPALQLALAVSLAGPLLRPLGVEPFMVHLAGASSCGKSTAARLAASLWGPLDVEGSPFRAWDGTANAIEFAFEAAGDAFLVLDELKRAGAPWVVRDVVHRAVSGMGRERSNRQGTAALAQRRWMLTALSTGEVGIAERLGDDAQGGEATRAIDVDLARGDATRSAVHAAALDRLARDPARSGAVADAWIRYLVDLPAHGWERLQLELEAAKTTLRSGCAADPEAGRIADRLALVALALNEARQGIGLELAPGEKVARWTLARVLRDRQGAASPEERAWAALQRHRAAHPAEWPAAGDTEPLDDGPRDRGPRYDQARDAVGIRQDGQAFTSEEMLKASGIPAKAGCSARRLLTWACSNGLADAWGRCRMAGQNRRWFRLNFDREIESQPFQSAELEHPWNGKWNGHEPSNEAEKNGVCSSVPVHSFSTPREESVSPCDTSHTDPRLSQRENWNTGTDDAHTQTAGPSEPVPLRSQNRNGADEVERSDWTGGKL